MRSLGFPSEADVLVVALDGYLRAQEAFALRVEDVMESDKGQQMTLRLGVAERGERTKTGVRQGVLVDYPYTKEVLRRCIAKNSPSDMVFSTTREKYMRAWAAAVKKMDMDVGPASNPMAPGRMLTRSCADMSTILTTGSPRARRASAFE